MVILLKEVKPSLDNKIIKTSYFLKKLVLPTATFSLKLVVEWQRLTGLPAKMTLVHARALLSTEKISYSYCLVPVRRFPSPSRSIHFDRTT